MGFIQLLRRIEDLSIVALLIAMITFSVFQIILRNLFDSGVIWGDPLLKQMVLWMALLGAMVAAREDKHINIDVVHRFLTPTLKPYVSSISKLATATICAMMAWFSLQFVQLEQESDSFAFSEIPVWWCILIIPFAFGVMALRYLILAFQAMFNPDSIPTEPNKPNL